MDIDVRVHPVAALFPMLADDELRELAEDIRQRGLLQPIVLAPDGSILDGRNRYAACQLAGVEPQYVTYEGDDPDGYAWSVNVKRRNLTKAQIAIVAADRYAVNHFTSRELAERTGVSHQLCAWAMTVRRYPDLHHAVLVAGESLKKAYEEAQRRDRVEAERLAKVERLRNEAPDLLAYVEAGGDIDEQLAALDARIQREREREQQKRSAEAEARRLLEVTKRGVTEKTVNALSTLLDQMRQVQIGEQQFSAITVFDPDIALSVHNTKVSIRLIAKVRKVLDEIERIIKEEQK